jgi:glycosyltransferase involved in cell wall biosynthesis
MKIVLLVLSGEHAPAREVLEAHYPGSEVHEVSRSKIANLGLAKRLAMLRGLTPEVFAVGTERLVWQRGQDALGLLGALAGARTVVMLDSHNGWKEESRASVMTKAPARLAREAAISTAAMRRAQKELSSFESAVERCEPPSVRADPGQPNLVYLRSSPGPGTQQGGAASHINGFINGALQIGARLSLITNDNIAGFDEQKVPVKIIWPRPLGSTRAAFDIYNNLLFSERAVKEIERQAPDFIYQRYARFSWAGVAAALKTKRPLFLEYNGSEVWVGRFWDRVGLLDLLARYERLNLKAATRVFVVSEVERENLLRAGLANEKIVVNPNAVDADLFRPNVRGDRVRHELMIAPDETLVGFIGTFGPWHGVEVLANAITQTPREAKLRFLLIGSGALRPKVEEILRAAHAEDRVIMVGAISHDRVPVMLDACDILVSPHVPLEDGSPFFGSPTKLFEYMAMGKAIVASRLGQIGEVLTHEQTALLVEPGNVAELANAIERLTRSRELREQLGAAARRDAVAKHTWKQNAQRVLNEYFSLSGSRTQIAS